MKRSRSQAFETDLRPSAADRISAQLRARRANQQALPDQQILPSQAPCSRQQPTIPAHPHIQAAPPSLSYREELPLSPPQQLSVEGLRENPPISRLHKRLRPTDEGGEEDQERPYAGRLTSAVDWGNPHYLDSREYDEDVPMVKRKRAQHDCSLITAQLYIWNLHFFLELREIFECTHTFLLIYDIESFYAIVQSPPT